jgi:hypothetical protein
MIANEAYVKALALLDELEPDGSVSSATDELYREKSIHLINLLSRTLARYTGAEYTAINGMDDELCIEDRYADEILVYGLAAKLALADNEITLYNEYQSLYNMGLNSIPVVESDIIDDMVTFR